MRRAAIVPAFLAFVIVGGVASAKGLKLKDLYDPQNPTYALEGYRLFADWEKLTEEQRQRARGVDPDEWVNPKLTPEEEEDARKAKEKQEEQREKLKRKGPPGRFLGFKFDRRMRLKQEDFKKLVGDNPAPSAVEGLIKSLSKMDKASAKFDKLVDEYIEEYQQIAGQYQKAASTFQNNYKKRFGKWPEQVTLSASLINGYRKQKKRLQMAVAVQQSETEFQSWVIDQLGGYLAALTDAELKKPLATLTKMLGNKDWDTRIRAARILGRSGAAPAVAAFQNAIAKEQDPLVLSELIRVRIKRGGAGLFELLKVRLDDPYWPVRVAVIRALGEVKKKESVDLLVARMAKEPGRLRDDIVEALYRLTGKRMDPDPEPWKRWWDKARASWTPPMVVKAKDSDSKDGKGEGVYFYGIRTSSKRIVFCIDFSGSMDWPLDGQNGKKPPRIVRAKKELYQAMAGLKEDAHFSVIVYSSGVTAWKKGRMMAATIKNKQAARKFIERKKAEGATNIYDALNKSLDIARPVPLKKQKDDHPTADTIFFLTDGAPTHGRIIDPNQILKEITSRNASLGVIIHTIGVSKDQKRGFLLNLAKQNGGRYVAHK